MPALLLPDESAPIRLMNTIWADRARLRHDDLASVDDLRAWLEAIDPASAGAAVDASDLGRFRALRDGLRRLAAFLTEDTRPAAASAIREVEAAVAAVNRSAARAPSRPLLALEGDRLTSRPDDTAAPADRCLASIAAQAIDLFTGPPRADLRACYGPGCVLYFAKDHPRREWCSPGCGNRARAARHYARHRDSR